MTALEGFKDTAALRKGMDAAVIAKRNRADATNEHRNTKAGRALLDSVPAEHADDGIALRKHIDEQIANGKQADKLAWQQLQKLVADRGLNRDAFAEELDKLVPELKQRQEEVEADTKQKIDDAAEFAKQYKAYTDVVPDAFLKARFEKDRSKVAARAIEQDIVALRKKLKEFSDKPVASVVPCPELLKLTQFVDELALEVDAIAHVAKCHLCQKENGVQRTEQAKGLIADKIVQLEALAKADAPGATAAEQADFALAKSLDQARTTPGEDGQMGGKMLGVLVCKDADDRTVLVYGYSGTLASNSRLAQAKIAAIEARKAIPAKIDAKALEVAKKQKELADQLPLVEKATADAVGKADESPEGKRLEKMKKGQTRISAELDTLNKEHAALEASRRDPDTLEAELLEARAAVPVASGLDDAVEASTGATWARPIPPDGVLKSVGGASQSLDALPYKAGDKPHGVCSAPKMIQQATAQGLTIVAMAEAWYGEGPNTHGELVASCATCMKNIGFQLCESCHA
jgi:hypothetical protein